jgi:hypothetical protein
VLHVRHTHARTFRFLPPAFFGERFAFGLWTAPAFFARGAFAFDPAALRAAILM